MKLTHADIENSQHIKLPRTHSIYYQRAHDLLVFTHIVLYHNTETFQYMVWPADKTGTLLHILPFWKSSELPSLETIYEITEFIEPDYNV